MDTQPAAFDVRNLSLSVGGKPILREVTFGIPSGEQVARAAWPPSSPRR